MKTQVNHKRCSGAKRALLVVMLGAFVVNSGCKIFSVLGSVTGYEEKIKPQYNLQAQQERKILVWLECSRSSDINYKVQEKLRNSFQFYLTEKAAIRPDNIIWNDSFSQDEQNQELLKIARSLGVGYVLLVQVEEYEMLLLNVGEYYSGQMVSRAVLLDTDLGIKVWPRQAGAKVIQIGVDLETKGRDAAVGRLMSATAHCTLRYLYPCKKLEFKTPDEKITIQDAYDMEPF